MNKVLHVNSVFRSIKTNNAFDLLLIHIITYYYTGPRIVFFSILFLYANYKNCMLTIKINASSNNYHETPNDRIKSHCKNVTNYYYSSNQCANHMNIACVWESVIQPYSIVAYCRLPNVVVASKCCCIDLLCTANCLSHFEHSK